MSIYTKLSALITAGALTFSGAALAQEAQTNTIDVEGLRVALTNIQTEISEVQALTSLSSENIQFVDVGQAIMEPESQPDAQTGGAMTGGATNEAGGEQATSVNELISQSQQQIVALRGAIEENGALSEVVQTQDIGIDDVVAVDVSDDGRVVVFYEQLEPQETEAMEAQPEILPTPEDDTDVEAGDDNDSGE